VAVTAGDPTVLTVARRSFVLVAGIPGAGKSSMLARRPIAVPGAVVLDSDRVREWLRDRLPAGLPYRSYRGLVHLLYRAQIVLTALVAVGPVVVHMPATAAFTRVAMVALAMLACRRRDLVWVHAEPEEARRGQRSRGRVLPRASFERHGAARRCFRRTAPRRSPATRMAPGHLVGPPPSGVRAGPHHPLTHSRRHPRGHRRQRTPRALV
jgi:predicted kinase